MIELEAGRQIDALIAERVMGWVRVPVKSALTDYMYQRPDSAVHLWPANVWKFSTGIAEAWEVVEVLRTSWHWCCIDIHSNYHYEWRVTLTPSDYMNENNPHQPTVDARAGTLPLAICRAALKAIVAAEAHAEGTKQ